MCPLSRILSRTFTDAHSPQVRIEALAKEKAVLRARILIDRRTPALRLVKFTKKKFF